MNTKTKGVCNEKWVAPNTVVTIDRSWIKNDLADWYEYQIIGKNGKLDDEVYTAIYYEIHDNLCDFLMECYSRVEERIEKDRQDNGSTHSK